NVLKKSFERKNLRYLVRKTDDKLAYCFRILNNTNGTAIVYVRSRKKTKEISDILSNEGISAEGYNAGLSPEEKEARQNRWKTGETRVMVATNAFGMGIDKADVRVVVHLDLPESVEAYFQEAGRAGRDGKESFAVLLYNSKDEATVKRHLTMSFPEEEYIKKVYSKICYQYEIGVGEGEGMSFQFDILDFCRRYKLSIEMVESSLEILKLENYISITEPESLRSRLMFTMSRDELYRNSFTDRDDLQEVLEYLMRNFTGIFTNYAYINEESIARSLGMSKRDLCGKLIALSHEGVITYIPAGKLPIITFIAPREDERRLYISQASYGDRLERATYRAMSMIEYASQTDTCRSKWLLGFFGEDNACDCGMCDVCMSANNGANQSRKALAAAILKALEAGELSINDIAQIGEDGAKANMLELRRLVESGKVVEIEGRDGFFKLAK
ncbi:MAG: RecQ family zinc-binding domain-containing protein, partial [Paludibacteraceae bacterium]|nr:RecQ family zinc-binding domain-containing protein [Paludibacteraceae bacterium]